MTHAELESAYLALCEDVERGLMRIVGLCGAKRIDDAGRVTADLLERVENVRIQYTMQQEQAGSYDLAALSVNPSVPSNSETGWERED